MSPQHLADRPKPHRNEIKMGAALSYSAIGIQFLVTLLYTPAMLRMLGQAEFGLYSLVSSIVAYLSLLSFGFGSAYMRFYSRLHAANDDLGVRRLNGLFLALFTTAGLLAGIAGMILSLNVEAVLGRQNFEDVELATARVLFLVMTANLTVSLPASAFSSYVLAHERFIFQKTVEIARLLLGPFAVLPILALGFGSIGMAVATTSISITSSVWMAAYAVRRLEMRFTLGGFDWKLLREITIFSSYIFVNMLVDQVNWNVDKFIIGRIYGAVPVAVYGVAALLNSSFLQFSTALSNLFIPRVNRMIAQNRPLDEVNTLFLRVGRIQYLVLALVGLGFIVFGRAFIAFWAGPSYVGAYAMGLWLMLPLIVPLIQNLGIEIQRAMNLHKFRSWAYAAFAAANVALTIPLALRIGPLGAAMATGITLLLGNGLVMNVYYHRRVGLNMKRFWTEILRMSVGLLPSAALGIVITRWADLTQTWILLVSGIAFVGMYIAGMWLLGMNQDERQLVRGVIRLKRFRRP